MQSMFVVLANVAIKHMPKVSLVDDQQSVSAFGPYGADPSFSDGVGVGRTDRSPHNDRALALPYFIEGRTELAIPIAQQLH